MLGLNSAPFVDILHKLKTFESVPGMQFDYKLMMDTAETSIPNALGMHIMCEVMHIGFIPDLIEKFGCLAIRAALEDEELLKLMDEIERQSLV